MAVAQEVAKAESATQKVAKEKSAPSWLTAHEGDG